MKNGIKKNGIKGLFLPAKLSPEWIGLKPVGQSIDSYEFKKKLK